ncbi:MAG: GTPase-associated system all-helical protein GASH [Bryobacteraceae bacterium]
MLRLFLFPKPETTENAWFTDGLLTLDKEFPVANNAEQLRLMAGVVMVTTFDEGSAEGCAFALGLRAAVFPKRSTLPAQPEILAAAEAYLQAEAERQRPTYFGDAPESRLAEQIRRLAEETGLLWWVISEYSTSLRRRTSGLTAPAYALIAAAEAADRTQILPPPPSADALLARVLKPCKSGPKKAHTLIDFWTAADAGWRAGLLRSIDASEGRDFVPIITGLAKCEEFGEAVGAARVVPKLCPGVSIEHPLSPAEAAQQLYVELMFLKALGALEKS